MLTGLVIFTIVVQACYIQAIFKLLAGRLVNCVFILFVLCSLKFVFYFADFMSDFKPEDDFLGEGPMDFAYLPPDPDAVCWAIYIYLTTNSNTSTVAFMLNSQTYHDQI